MKKILLKITIVAFAPVLLWGNCSKDDQENLICIANDKSKARIYKDGSSFAMEVMRPITGTDVYDYLNPSDMSVTNIKIGKNPEKEISANFTSGRPFFLIFLDNSDIKEMFKAKDMTIKVFTADNQVKINLNNFTKTFKSIFGDNVAESKEPIFEKFEATFLANTICCPSEVDANNAPDISSDGVTTRHLQYMYPRDCAQYKKGNIVEVIKEHENLFQIDSKDWGKSWCKKDKIAKD